MAGSGGADDAARSADPIPADDSIVDANARPSPPHDPLEKDWDPTEHNLDSLRKDWDPVLHEIDSVNERLEAFTTDHATDSGVSELRKEVKELGVKIDGLKKTARELRETLAKAEDAEQKAWSKNNQLLDNLYQEVVLERNPRGTSPERRTTKRVRSRKKPAGLIRKMFCAG